MTIKSVMVFGNFNVCVFDEKGEQVPELQCNLLSMWADLAHKEERNPDGLVIETPLGRWRMFKVEGGYNLESA